jgi:hypothetical protein
MEREAKTLNSECFRILHTNGFNETELINYRYMIHTNYIVSYHYVVKGMFELHIEVPEQESVRRISPDRDPVVLAQP